MARKVKVTRAVFGHCLDGKHDDCRREFNRWYWDGKKMVETDELVKCECSKRGCPCFVKKADRGK